MRAGAGAPVPRVPGPPGPPRAAARPPGFSSCAHAGWRVGGPQCSSVCRRMLGVERRGRVRGGGQNSMEMRARRGAVLDADGVPPRPGARSCRGGPARGSGWAPGRPGPGAAASRAGPRGAARVGSKYAGGGATLACKEDNVGRRGPRAQCGGGVWVWARGLHTLAGGPQGMRRRGAAGPVAGARAGGRRGSKCARGTRTRKGRRLGVNKSHAGGARGAAP
jgi:hypothetical protein